MKMTQVRCLLAILLGEVILMPVAGYLCGRTMCSFPDVRYADRTTSGMADFCRDSSDAVSCWRNIVTSVGCQETKEQKGRETFIDFICSSDNRQLFIEHGSCLQNVGSESLCFPYTDFEGCSDLYYHLQCMENMRVTACGHHVARQFMVAESKKYVEYYRELGCEPYEASRFTCYALTCPYVDMPERTTSAVEVFCRDYAEFKSCRQEQIAATNCLSRDYADEDASIDFMCTPQGRTGYVEHAPCYMNDTGNIKHNQKCPLSENPSCQELEDHIGCSKRSIQVCGSAAMDFYGVFIRKGLGSYFERSHCGSNKYEPSASSASSNVPWITYDAITLILVFKISSSFAPEYTMI